MTRARGVALGAGLALLGAAVWWRRNPSACPYGQRFWVEAPHPFITRARLAGALAPRSGERLLEVGPGTGYYTLAVADALGPEGRLDIVDVQQEMLDHTMRAASAGGLTNVTPHLSDARSLPFGDGEFAGAYLVTVLGEVPDQDVALRELRRVLEPGARLVVGELFGDPHMVTEGSLRRRAEAAGFRYQRRFGPSFGYFARLLAV
ncbi:MAG TPA: class I SAM-dependent methyltransferase [Thermoleophilaceae bacterium]